MLPEPGRKWIFAIFPGVAHGKLPKINGPRFGVRKGMCITIITASRYFRTPGHGIPGCVSPLDTRGCRTHRMPACGGAETRRDPQMWVQKGPLAIPNAPSGARILFSGIKTKRSKQHKQPLGPTAPAYKHTHECMRIPCPEAYNASGNVLITFAPARNVPHPD